MWLKSVESEFETGVKVFDFDNMSISVDKEDQSVASVLSLLIFSSDSKDISPTFISKDVDSLVSLLFPLIISSSSSSPPLLRRPGMIPEIINQKRKKIPA